MKIRVNFRVTGMYFGRSSAFDNDPVILTVKEKPTVKDLLKEVEELVRNRKFPNIDSFAYGDNEKDELNSITIVYNKEIKTGREAGTYTMTDQKQGDNKQRPNQSLVFQYYIFDENFKQLNNNNRSRSFNKPPDVEIKDKYSVVIRQVVILNNSEEAIKNIV